MVDAARARNELDYHELWERMRQLLERTVTTLERNTFLDETLDLLVDLLGADRGMIVLGDPDQGAQAVGARRRGRDIPAGDREQVSRSVMREAADGRRCVVWRPDHGQGRGSLVDLGIVAAMAAPLRASTWSGRRHGDGVRGVVYVDYRDPRAQVTELHEQFLEAAAILVATVLEQQEALFAAREDLRAVQVRGGVGDKQPALQELLRPRSMEHLRKEVDACLRGDSPILILGESGTGKTALARAIAEASGQTPVVRAVLGASDDLNTITSELFGHERGAFSGAVSRRRGVVEFADGGTLILDEILNLPKHAQQLLLDFTQFGTFRPLGYQGEHPKTAKVRLIAATNGDLRQAIADGRFREDLYYRLSAVPLVLPPLRERREDIPFLAETYLRRIGGVVRWRLSSAARRLLVSEEIEWAGNIRELESVVRRARERALAEDGDSASVLRPEHLMPRDLTRPQIRVPEPGAPQGGYDPVTADFVVVPDELDDSWTRLVRERDQLDEFERQIIVLCLEKHKNVVAHVARELGVPRTSLISRMNTLGIDPKKKSG